VPTNATTADGQVSDRGLRRVGVLSLVGSSAEWFDYFLYAVASALVFPTLFFPNYDPSVGLLASFVALAAGYVSRPLGGIVWGHFGDRFGRKKAFLAALGTMAAGSTLIGLLPSYAVLGITAPILLIVLRFLQGLAIGGQWGGGVLLATEYAPMSRRGYFGSLPQLGVPIGTLIGNVAFFALGLNMDKAAFMSWGWRIPFLCSALIIPVAVYAHRALEETPAFLHLKKLASARAEAGLTQSPLSEVFRTRSGTVLMAAGLFVVVNATNIIYTTFMLNYVTRVLHMTLKDMLIATAIGAAFTMTTIVGFAKLSDRIGRRRLMIASGVFIGLWAFPIFWVVNTGTLWGLVLGTSLAQVFNTMMYGPLAAFFAELFPARMRYSGASLCYQIGGLVGGLLGAPVVAWLYEVYNTTAAISVFVVILAVVSVGCAIALPETYRRKLDDAELTARPATRSAVPEPS
jgi:MFS family permease